MELVTQKNNETLKETDLASPLYGISSTHALVTDVEFSGGKKSSIVTLFNNSDFSFEEIKIGVYTSLYRQPHLGIIKRNTTLYAFVNGNLKKAAEFKSQ